MSHGKFNALLLIRLHQQKVLWEIKYFSIYNKIIFQFEVKSIFARRRLSNVVFKFSLRIVQFFFLMANRPVGETSCRRTVLSANLPVGELSLSAKCPVNELSCRRTVLSAKCPVGELSVDELSLGEVSLYRQPLWESTARTKSRSLTVQRTLGPFRKAYNKKLFSVKIIHNRPKIKSVWEYMSFLPGAELRDIFLH